MTTPEWGPSRSTPKIFDWDITDAPCRMPCTDPWHAGRSCQIDQRPTSPSSKHLEVEDEQPVS